MNYQQAYDKIIQAYFNNEIKPLDSKFCFCGTLCDNTYDWSFACREKHNDSHGYKGNDFVLMENALFEGIYTKAPLGVSIAKMPGEPYYEDALFNGMCEALEVLKEIHRSRGEDVDAITVPFTKRQAA